MQGSQVRQSFLDYFAGKQHLIVPSAPIVPLGDPTLMFTNAGMVPFKDVFLGLADAPAARVADSQKCLRISGKHNDLEEVGRDTYHHTLFEMLGNWSFGDYYKPEAIEWAWELLTSVWGLPKDRLYATVYRTDDEAADLWPRLTDLPAERVLRFDEKDNFWEMGETGPCGPCSEIHIDRGPGSCDMQHVPGHVCAVNVGCSRYIELWNLVFIQYSRDEKGQLHELPAKHVDTGMGLERVAAVLEKVDGNYEGSLLREIIRAAESLSGARYGADPEADISFRVLADHGRAVSFMIADGIAPGNDGRGYVLRRLLRRAARHGKNLGMDEVFLYQVCRRVIETMGEAYPELGEHRDKILDTVRDEEERFATTLGRGLVVLDEEVGRLSKGATVLPGDIAFRLYDTYGFPLDMTEDILRGRGIEVDRPGFEASLAEQRERGRGAQAAKAKGRDYTLAVAAARERGGVRFIGDRRASGESEIVALSAGGELLSAVAEGRECELVTAETPFYGESGGQVGDTGVIEKADGSRARIEATAKPSPDAIVHHAVIEKGRFEVGDEVRLTIDGQRRERIRLNHSATHLLHAALRHHLGEGVGQAGSLVDPRRLRFDFSHNGAVRDEALVDIEREVNEAIRANYEVSNDEMAFDDALAAGALAFFGDKYGDRVRVVRMGDYSVELCGGTHVARTGDIGVLRIASEGGVAAGVRRIEATTGEGALEVIRHRDALLGQLARLLKSTEDDAPERVERLLAQVRDLEKQVEQAVAGKSRDLVGELVDGARDLGGPKAVVAAVEGVDAKSLRTLSDRVRERLGSGVVVVASVADGKVGLIVGVTDDLTDKVNAGAMVRELAPLIGGRGGGKADFAQAGGNDATGLQALLEKAYELLV
jgi:alanyl-tRNA synthetase